MNDAIAFWMMRSFGARHTASNHVWFGTDIVTNCKHFRTRHSRLSNFLRSPPFFSKLVEPFRVGTNPDHELTFHMIYCKHIVRASRGLVNNSASRFSKMALNDSLCQMAIMTNGSRLLLFVIHEPH